MKIPNTLGRDGIDLVDKDYCWGVLRSLFKDLFKLLLRPPLLTTDDLGSVDGIELAPRLVRNRFGN